MFMFSNIPPPPQPPGKRYIAEDVSVVKIAKKIKKLWKNNHKPGEYSYFKTHVKTIIVGSAIYVILSLLGLVPYIIVWLDGILRLN